MTSKPTSAAALRRLDVPTLDERVLATLRDDTTILTRRELAQAMNEQASTISGSINRLMKAQAVVVGANTTCRVTGRYVQAIYPAEELKERP